MRKLTIHACALGVTLSSSLLASANAASWDGSYVADGECFCAGTQGREIDSQIFPTPVGGQSVSQICERIGSGPTLQKVNGKFNFSVYPDAQCGNGPFVSDTASNDSKACSGHLGVAGEDCADLGPKWDLKSAYAKPAEVKLGISDTVAVTGGSHYIKPPALTNKSSSTSVANTSVATVAKPQSKPKKVVQVAPLTPEQLRARQLVQMEAARERARLASASESNESATPAKPVVQATVIDSDKEVKAEAVTKVIKAEAASKDAVETSAETLSKAADASSSETDAVNTFFPAIVSALRMPLATRNSAREFDYVEGLPVSYDFGGNGMRVAASTSSHNKLQYVLRAAATKSYSEALLGIGYIISPKKADRITVSLNAGIEHGKFRFQRPGIAAQLADTGIQLSVSSRFVIDYRFELQAGVGYSSFFEGDAIMFGSAFYHLTPKIDLTTKAEVGDNDSLAFGIRYYY